MTSCCVPFSATAYGRPTRAFVVKGKIETAIIQLMLLAIMYVFFLFITMTKFALTYYRQSRIYTVVAGSVGIEHAYCHYIQSVSRL